MLQNGEILTLPRKEREKKSRQQDILNAARILFSQKGYHETTLEEIAHRAEFAKGTIYNYFANKDELFFGIIEAIFETLNSIAEQCMSAEGMTVREKLLVYAKNMMQYSQDHSDLFKIIMREGPRPSPDELDKRMKEVHEMDLQGREFIAEVLRQEMSKGELREMDPRLSAIFFDGMLKFYCMHHVKRDDPLSESDIDQAANTIVTIFFDGIKHT